MKGGQPRKHQTFGSRVVTGSGPPIETNLEYKLDVDDLNGGGASPQPSASGITKHSSDAYAANSTDESKRQAVLSFG